MMKTLKHQLLWLKTWDDVDQVNEALQAFGETDNKHWMVGRWGYKSPAPAREELTPSRRAAGTTDLWPRDRGAYRG